MNLQTINELKQLNSVTNHGRGSSVLANVIMCLEQGDITGAHQCAYVDSDKLRQYPKVEARLKQLGFDVGL